MQIRIHKVELIIGAHNDPSANDEHFGDADNTDVFNIEFTMWHDGENWNRYSLTHTITRHKCLDGKTRSVAINGLEGFVEYIYNTELPLLWPISGRRTWKKHAVPQDGVVYFRAKRTTVLTKKGSSTSTFGGSWPTTPRVSLWTRRAQRNLRRGSLSRSVTDTNTDFK